MGKDDRRMSTEWGDLQEKGEVPDRGKGTTAERAEKDKKRKRPRYPAEDRRQGCKISPTLSPALVDRLRAICKAEGYVSEDGEGAIASPVIEDLLWIAVEAYEQGELEQEEVVVEVRRQLRRKTQK